MARSGSYGAFRPVQVLDREFGEAAAEQESVIRIAQVAQHAPDLNRTSEFHQRLLQQPPTAVFDPAGTGVLVGNDVRLLLDRVAPPVWCTSG